MTSAIERILILRSTDCFSILGLDVLAAIARRLRPERLLPGAPWRLGGDVLFVTDGEVFQQAEDGTRRRCSAGEAVGIVSALAGTTGDVETFVVDAPAGVLVLAADDLEDLCLEDFDVGESLLRWLAGTMLRSTVRLPDGTPIPTRAPRPEETMDTRVSPLVRRIAALTHSAMFPFDQADAIAELAHQAEEVAFPAGEPLWDVGSQPTAFLLLLEGEVRCESRGGWHSHAGPHSLVGDLEALADAPREFKATTRSSGKALRLPADSFLDILEDHPRLAVDFLAQLARRAQRIGQLG